MIDKEMYTKFALQEALRIEYAWIDGWDESAHEHVFSDAFIERMEKIETIAEREYVSIGRHRVSRLVACALIAATLMVLAGCGFAIGKALIKWNEANNNTDRTMDITFELGDPEVTPVDHGFRRPHTPEGYKAAYSDQQGDALIVEYQHSNGNKNISYLQEKNVYEVTLSIDNDDTVFRETTVSGWKGYVKDKENSSYLVWCDGTYVYYLSGDETVDVLREMAESMNLQGISDQ